MFSFKILLLILACLWISGAAANVLNPGDKLNSSDRLVSQSQNVTLSFYKQEYGQNWGNKSAGYYLAINYTVDSLGHSIWLANRDDPVEDESGVLIIDDTGLKITRDGGDPIHLYSPLSSSINMSSMKLVLQDSGNLVFQDTNSNGEIRVWWESFDYPTDTFLPGMKLGVSRGKRRSLTSWLTESIPAPGAFTLVWDPERERLVVWLGKRVLWTSGENLKYIREFYPWLMNLNFTHVSNADDQYLYYTLVNEQFTPEDWRKNGRVMLRRDGSLLLGNMLNLFSSSNCDGNSTENGCERWEGPKCRSIGDKYEERTIRPTHKDSLNNTLMGNTNLSINDCKDICWKDCKCLGVYKQMNLGCQFLSGPYVEGVLDGMSFEVIIHKRSKSKGWIWILISLPIALTITILLGTLFYLRRRRKIQKEEKFLLELMTSDKTSEIKELQTGNNGHNLNVYNIALIMSATNSFSPQNMLGQGGFGPVFKGTLPNGQEVAIKRLSGRSKQGLVEFKNELIFISKLQHINLVRLLGFCVQGEEKMLAYEYMPNKSLDSFIFDESKSKLLDWVKRFNIIEGIAQGLLYLHKYSRLKIIHRDLKLSNILLDENMNPKISDFGMARIYTTNEAEPNTNRIVGTYGYMSPEYAMEGIFSVKSDVYSFGVMVLEVVSGRKNTSHFNFDRPLNLVGYAWELWKDGMSLDLVDPILSDSCDKHQVLRCITLGLLCVEDNPVDRPTMSEVISMLTGEMQLPLPKHPAFSTGRRSMMETNVEERNMENLSLNGLSISVMDARS